MRIVSAGATGPGSTTIGTLSNPAELVSGNGNLFRGEVILQPSTTYYVLMDLDQAGATSFLVGASATGQTGSFTIGDESFERPVGGGSWTKPANTILQIGVNGYWNAPPTLVSNVRQQTGPTANFGGDLAQAFRTGTNPYGYKLTGLDIRMSSSAATPPNYQVRVHEDADGRPSGLAGSLGTLANPRLSATEGNHVFTALGGGIDLEPTTVNWVVVDVIANHGLPDDTTMVLTKWAAEDIGKEDADWNIWNSSRQRPAHAPQWPGWSTRRDALVLAIDGHAKQPATQRLVSNTGTADAPSVNFTNNRAQAFATGSAPGGYTLTHVDIPMGSSASTAPSYQVKILGNDNGSPDESLSLGTLRNPVKLESSGLHRFTAPGDGIKLAGGTTYWVAFLVTNNHGEGANTTIGVTASINEDPGSAPNWSIWNLMTRKGFTDTSWTTVTQRSLKVAVHGRVNSAASGPPPAPAIEMVRFVSSPAHDSDNDGQNDTYVRTDEIAVDVEFSRPIKIVGDKTNVRLRLDLGTDDTTPGNSRKTLSDGPEVLHGGMTLRFKYRVAAADSDTDGMWVQTGSDDTVVFTVGDSGNTMTILDAITGVPADLTKDDLPTAGEGAAALNKVDGSKEASNTGGPRLNNVTWGTNNRSLLQVQFTRALDTSVDTDPLPFHFSIRGTHYSGGVRNAYEHPNSASFDSAAGVVNLTMSDPVPSGHDVWLTYRKGSNPSRSLVSNTGETSASSGNAFNIDFAVPFTTGHLGDHGGDYRVTRLDMALANSGSTQPAFSVAIHENTFDTVSNFNRPDTVLGTFTNPATISGSESLYQFTAPGNGIDLDTNTTYWVAVDVTTSNTNVTASLTASDDEDSGTVSSWNIGDGHLTRVWNAISWGTTTFTNVPKIAIHGRALGPVRDSNGLEAPGFVDVRVDTTTAPLPVRASVAESTLELVFNQALSEAHTPVGSDFVVDTSDVDGDTRRIWGTGMTEVSGDTVTVGLAKRVRAGELAKVSYLKKSTSLQSTGGTKANAFDNFKVAFVADLLRPAIGSGGAVQTQSSPAQTKIVLPYNEPLDEDSVPDLGDFSVTVGSNAAQEPTVVAVSGNSVTLTVAAAASSGTTIKVSYVPGTKPVRDLAGNAAAGFEQSITASASGAPVQQSASVAGARLAVTYDRVLNPEKVPGPDRFTVHYPLASTETAADRTEYTTVTAATVEGADLVLQLTTPVYPCAGGTPITVTYTKPSGATPNLQGLTGTLTATLDAVSVTNGRSSWCASDEDGLPYVQVPGHGKPPGFVRSLSTPSTLILQFDRKLNTAHELPASAFSLVGVSDTPPPEVTGAAYTDDATGVVLTLDRAVASGEKVTVSYRRPQNEPGLWYAGGKQIANFSGVRVPIGPPAVTGVAVVSDAGNDDTYGLGNSIRVRLTFGHDVDVTGTPRLKIKMDPDYGEKWALYESGSGSTELTFAYTVAQPNVSTQGIALLADTLELNGGAIASTWASEAAELGHDGLGHDADHKVDWQVRNTPATGAPAITGTTQVGETLTAGTSGISDADGLTNAVFSYQWLIDDADVSGAAGSTYTLSADAEGKAVKVRVSFTDDAGNDETLTSAATAAVAPPPNRAPVVDEDADHYAAFVSADWAPRGIMVSKRFEGIFSDPDGDELTYSVSLADDRSEFVDQVRLEEDLQRVFIRFDSDKDWYAIDSSLPVPLGTTVTLTATDPDGLTVSLSGDFKTNWDSPATGAPTIVGTARVGETLTADTSDISDGNGLVNVTFSFQWLADDADISGATGSTYILVAADQGKAVKVRVSFTDDAGNDESLTSAATAAVAAATPPEVTGVAVTSTPASGDTYGLGEKVRVTLTFNEAVAVTGTPRLKIKMDPDYGEKWATYDSGGGSVDLVFAHEVVEPNISTQGIALLGNTLELNGGSIKATATQADAALAHDGLAHDPDHKVDWRSAPNNPATGAPAITGTARVGEALTAGTSGISDADGLATATYNYQWLADDAVISRATGSTYTLADAEVGKVVTVRVSFTDDAGHDESLTSAGTAAVAARPPEVTGVSVSSSPASGDTYALGEKIRIKLIFSETVTVSGSPRLQIDMDPAHWGQKWALYESGSGTTALVFAHEVVEPNISTQGIALLGNTLELNGGSIKATATQADAALAHDGLAHDPDHKVDWR